MKFNQKFLFITSCLIWIFSCKENLQEHTSVVTDPLFILKNNKEIGLNFENNLEYDKDFNVYKYRNFYNGGGVALGDINNDGLIDVYMVSNQKSNKLFLNKGNWKFQDITEKSKAGGTKAWSTGATMADVNADGFLDIYVCNSGDVNGDNKENELFINNGDLTFTESAAKFNLNDKGYSTHASFFDYDKDGDLDCYILNNSFKAIGSFDLKLNQRNKRDELGGDKLMENRNGKFVDVSEKAGIYGSIIGFGLGITIGDVNNDNWEDIFISNDFFERDYLYINQKNGTFKEDLVNQMPSISGASMGADIADVNNDGWNEIFVTEMLPSDYQRLKTVTTFDDWNRYNFGVQNGYHHQFTRNVLHLNNANGTFSEISRFAGIEASDWSWGALFFDMDNDGNKDLFIANGIFKDLTNQDYLQYVANDSVMNSIINDKGVNYKKLIDIIPSNKIPNHSYKNLGNLKFENYTQSGLNSEGFSNGSAYGDIDNDGDLDLIVNNVNMPCFVYENKANENFKDNHFLKFILKGKDGNVNAFGARIEVRDKDKTYLIENQPIRGFESTMDPRPNLGVGKADQVDIMVTWPSQKVSILKNVKTNQTLQLNEADAIPSSYTKPEKISVFEKTDDLPFVQKELPFNDFNRENLLYHMTSTRGPCACSGDLNGDKQIDIVIPGSKGTATRIFFGTGLGKYEESNDGSFSKTIESEQIKCELFDADLDNDLDLFLISGGVELSAFSEYLYDQLYLNNGKGSFELSPQKFPTQDLKINSGALAKSDIDGDGDVDLFIGERSKIDSYGEKCSGYLLVNNGKGNFKEMTFSICPGLKDIGLVTDAVFCDLDGDKKDELIVVGEFMGISVFKNKSGFFQKINLNFPNHGWWNAIEYIDIENDGDMDLVIGNHGTNSRFKADPKNPLSMYFLDFDDNGFGEGIMTKRHDDGKDYPYSLRHTLMSRIPSLKKKFPNFESFKHASIETIFDKDKLVKSQKSYADELHSLLLINKGGLKFDKKILPDPVQFSPIYAIAKCDINKDGYQDLILGGNLYNVQPEMGRYDASYGHVLINDKKGNFTDRARELGFVVKGEIRDIEVINNKIYIFRNNDSVLSYKIK